MDDEDLLLEDEFEEKDHKKASIVLSVLALLILLFLTLLIVFRVKNVEVTGNYHNTDQEIRERVMKAP